VGLLDTLHIDVTQQPKQGVGMGQRFEFGKQQLEVGLELGAGHLPVDLAPGGELKDEHQQPIEQQDRVLVSAFARVS